MLGVVRHENFGSRLDTFALGLLGGITEHPVGEVEGGLIGPESRHMFRRGLKGHDVFGPMLQPRASGALATAHNREERSHLVRTEGCRRRTPYEEAQKCDAPRMGNASSSRGASRNHTESSAMKEIVPKRISPPTDMMMMTKSTYTMKFCYSPRMSANRRGYDLDN